MDGTIWGTIALAPDNLDDNRGRAPTWRQTSGDHLHDLSYLDDHRNDHVFGYLAFSYIYLISALLHRWHGARERSQVTIGMAP